MKYDFKCEKCNHVWEANKKLREPNPDCPKCGAHNAFVEIVITKANPIKFNGNGFYCTDYKTKKERSD